MQARYAVVIGAVCALSAWGQDTPLANFAGAWESTYGFMQLSQDGAQVKGTYGSSSAAVLSGTVSGRRLTFSYREPEAQGEGWFELDAEGERFRGKWREVGASSWASWVGQRLVPEAGVFLSDFGRLRLVSAGKGKFRGRYLSSGSPGTIEGELSGDTLRFTWREPKVAGEGEFVFDPARTSFRGRWRTGEGAWKPWNGKRLKPERGTVWLTVIEAHWEERLDQPEYSWGAMLRAYLKRHPHVRVRQRRVHDRADLERALFEVALLNERAAVLISCHGEGGTLWAGSDRVPAKDVASALRDAPNAFLIHFSSCEVFVKGIAEQLLAAAGRPLAVSGYAVAVDWAGSAVLEFLYLDLILGRGMRVQSAAKIVRDELRFAGERGTRGSPIGGLKFRVFGD